MIPIFDEKFNKMNFLPESFHTFYKTYLSEHRNPMNRFLHHLGSLFAILFIIIGLLLSNYFFFLLALSVGYGLAWMGHFFIEKNKPTSFRQPVYSFIADFVMLYDFFSFELERKIQNLD